MLKNKIVVRKIRNIMILIMAMIVMVGAYRNIGRSRAEDVIEIGVLIQDNYGYLQDEEVILEAKEIENDLYEIELPESVNTKKVEQIVKVALEERETTSENTSSELQNEETESSEPEVEATQQPESLEPEVDATQQPENVIPEENGSQEENTASEENMQLQEGATPEENNSLEIVENKIYLTKEQIENQKINIEVVYGIKILGQDENGELVSTALIEKTEEERAQIEITEETQILYNKILRYEDKENAKLVEVKGFLPRDAKLQVEGVTQEQLIEIFGDKKIDVAYDIKIIREVIRQIPTDEADPDAEPEEIIEIVEINPEDFKEFCEVTIKDAKIQKDAKVYHVKEDNTYEDVNVKENAEENVSFDAHTFSIYAVGPEIDDEGIMAQAATSVTFSPSSNTTWANSYTVSFTINSYSPTETYYYKWYNYLTSSYNSDWQTLTAGSSSGARTTPSSSGKWGLYIGVKRVGATTIASLGSSGAFWVDRAGPSKPTLTKSPDTEWSASDVTVTISGSTDAYSGLNYYAYDWISDFYQYTYTQIPATNSSNTKTVTFSEDMNKTLYVKAVDNTNNAWWWSDTASIPIKIDKTNPTAATMTMKLGGSSGSAYTNNSWTNKSVYIALNNDASDGNGSGVASTKYSVTKNGSAYLSSQTGANTLSDQGTYVITVTTTDNVGHTGTRTYTVKIDKTNPTGTGSVSTLYTNQSTVTAYVNNVSDTGGSGVQSVGFIGFAGSSTWGGYGKEINGTYDSTNNRYYATFSFSEMPDTATGNINKGEGKYYFSNQLRDNAGNIIYPGASVIYDKTAPTISVSTTSCTWRNSAISTTITLADPTTNAYDGNVSGLATNNSYQYYLSNSSSALSGGAWTDYTSGTAITLNPGVSGTYYLFVKRVSDKAGNASTSGGTATTVGSTTYQRFGAFQFDYDVPIGTLTASPTTKEGTTYYTNQDSFTAYVQASDTGGSGLKNTTPVKIIAWAGGTWVSTHTTVNGSYNSSTGKYSSQFDFSNIVHTSTESTGNGEGNYYVKSWIYDNAGNSTLTSDTIYMIYDKTAPTISVSTTSCTWRNSAISTTITLADPTTNAYDGQVSGLATSNSYQYYLSKSSTALSGGSWTNYTSGTAISLNPGSDGEYYLFVKRVNDKAGNTSTSGGTATTISSTTYQRFGPYCFDYTKPAITYSHQALDIDKEAKSYTMTFRGTDAHYATKDVNSILTLDNLEILMQNGQLDGSGNPIIYDLKEEPVTLYFRTLPYTGPDEKTGYTYILTVSDLEKLEIKSGLTTADYSGVISVAVPGGVLKDIAGNTNNQTTITSGINIPGGQGQPSTDVPIDVVDPLWNKATSSVTQENGVATLTVRGTDTYFLESTLTTDKIGVFVNGTQLTSANGVGISLSEPTALNETRKQYGSNVTVQAQYGVEYTISFTGLPDDMEQLKIVLASGTLKDQSGNENKTTEFSLYTTLKWTGLETGPLSGFLGNSSIQRENIANVTFVTSTASANSTKWDVSAKGDNSILAWYETLANGSLRVYIGSDEPIYANKDSSYLFTYIGYGNNCTTTEVITNLNLLKTSHVTNMKAMFAFTGYRSMTSLNLTGLKTGNATNMKEMFNGTGYKKMTTFTLPSTFDPSNATDMSWMFANLGYTKMTSMNLVNFDTSNATDMSYMFANCGYNALTSLSLGTIFDTSEVTDMSYMFSSCGVNAMTSLDLGGLFDTSNVTNMSHMFYECGYWGLTNFDLGELFDTENVTDMNSMFYSFAGYSSLTRLYLGDKFYTTNVTDMTDMFYCCGENSMTELDLGPAFTHIAINNSGFFKWTGVSGNCTIYAPEAIYKNINQLKTSIKNVPSMPSYIPTGFVHVKGTTMQNGYVVSDSSGNEYVWIEVPKNSTVYDEIGTNIDLDSLSGTELTTALNNIEEELKEYAGAYRETGYTDTWVSEEQHGFESGDEYNDLKYTMLKSIYKYGGFYIGRYETGTDKMRSSSSDPESISVIQPNMYPYNHLTNKEAQEIASEMASGTNTSSLMFGIQWDLVLKHLETKGATQEELKGTTTGSTYWGNYIDTVYNITNTNAKYATSADSWAWKNGAYGQKNAGTSVFLSTGADAKFSKMGIYDLAGNAWEFTLETTPYDTHPISFRGGGYGYYGNDDPVSSRVDAGAAFTNRYLGFRVALYKNDTEDDITLTYDRGHINPKYKPEWKVTGTTVTKSDITNKIDITLKGITTGYTSNLTAGLELEDISVWIDGTELTNIEKTFTNEVLDIIGRPISNIHINIIKF